MPRGRKKAVTTDAPAPEAKKEDVDMYVTVSLDMLSGKVSVKSDSPIALNINKEVANLMLYYYKGNHGLASYKLVIEGLSAGNVISEGKGDKIEVYKAPLSYWEMLISLSDLLANVNSTLSFQLGRKTTWWKEKKTVSIVKKVKVEAS